MVYRVLDQRRLFCYTSEKFRNTKRNVNAQYVTINDDDDNHDDDDASDDDVAN